MTGALRLAVPPEAAGSRLDAFLATRLTDRTRSALRRLILEGRVLLDGRAAAKAGTELRAGMQIEVRLPEPALEGLEGETIPLPVVHEDEDLVVIDKPAGLVVHPGAGRRTGTLVHALLGRGTALAPAGGALRPGIVHRLDAGTTGVLVVAKSDAAYHALQRAFAERRIVKTYDAVVWGVPEPPSGRIEAAIGRSRADRTRMAVRVPRARAAVSEYATVEHLAGFAHLEVRITTGRTHQIRVHLQSIHHPVVGDARYGGIQWRGVVDPGRRNALRAMARPALHARELSFAHPITGKRVTFRAPLPADMERLLSALRRRTT